MDVGLVCLAVSGALFVLGSALMAAGKTIEFIEKSKIKRERKKEYKKYVADSPYRALCGGK